MMMVTQRILISNAKGGCGKTTIATNIASYFASRGKIVQLFDYDTQGSSLHWKNCRSDQYPDIAVVDATKRSGNHITRSWQMRVPPETDIVVIDTAAGLSGSELASMLRDNDMLIIPVLPSPIDIQSTAHFIKDVLLIGKARKKQVRIAVVANRIRKNTLMYHSLERFLFTLKLPFVTSFRDTQLYNKAIAKGIGILELKPGKNRIDFEQWAPLIRWMETPILRQEGQVRPIFGQKVSI